MSLLAVWMVPRPSENRGAEVAFSRFYQTFIKKAKQTDGKNYVEIPPNPEFAKLIMFTLGYGSDQENKFIASRDSCKIQVQKPVYEISTSSGVLWPVVIVEQNDIVFCCLPFVAQGAHNRPPLIDIAGVTLGFTLMCALTEFMRNVPPSEVHNKVTELYGFLTQAAPFGTLLNTTVESVIARMNNRPSPVPKTQRYFSHIAAAGAPTHGFLVFLTPVLPQHPLRAPSCSSQQPAWKPVSHKGKSQMFLSITEYVRAVQYDKENIDDVWDVYGTISCKAELEGVMPTVTLMISQTTEGEATPINHILIHPCVQSADAQIVTDGSHISPRRVRFTPPLEMITLCHYTVCQPQKCPINGSFEMFVEERRAKVNVRLKLNENIKNQFEYCELQIPVHNSSIVAIQDSSLNHGNLIISNDKNTLVWNIGQKFPVKASEIHMSAVLILGESSKSKLSSVEDQFCSGQTTYAMLCFKIPDYTMSGCFIDPKSIQVSPAIKYKLTSVREFLTVEYKLWNVHGDSLVSAIPKFLFTQPDFDEDA